MPFRNRWRIGFIGALKLKAIVHIGTEKTGTSSIQRFLYQNQKTLKSAGFHFVQSAGTTNNRALPAYCISDDSYDEYLIEKGISTPEGREKFRRNFIAKFESELESLGSNIHTVIISSEHFHSRLHTEDEMDNVHRLLSAYFDSIKIVCYIREQGATCTSFYTTNLRAGGTKTFSEIIRLCTHRNKYYNYYEMLLEWEKRFGFESIDLSIYDHEKFLNKSLLDDFISKIDPELVGALDKRIAIENKSLRPSGQALARAINCAFPVRTARVELLAIREKIQNIIYRELKGKGQQPSLATRNKVFSLFAESNQRLKDKYFPNSDSIFDDPDEQAKVERVLDNDFIGVVIRVLGVVKKELAGLVSAQEVSDIYAHILSCSKDISAEQEEQEEKNGKELTLTDDDARLFKNAALRLESTDLASAVRLMSLAADICPARPILEKLESYVAAETEPTKHQYFLSYGYNSDDDHARLSPILLGSEFRTWLKQLESPFRNRFSVLADHKAVHENGDADAASTAGSTWAFTIFEAESIEKAVAIAAECPFLLAGGSVELSEVVGLLQKAAQT